MLPIGTPQPIGSGTPQPTAAAAAPVSPPLPPSPRTVAHRQSPEAPDTPHQYNCRQCGASIDVRSGQCPTCGLLHGKKVPERIPQPGDPTAPTPEYPPSTPMQVTDEPPLRAPVEPSIPSSQKPFLKEITEGQPREWHILESAKKTLAKLGSATQRAIRAPSLRRPFAGKISRPAPRQWSVPASTGRLLLRGFWAVVFLAIAGFGGYYAVTELGNVSLPSTSTANPVAIPSPAPGQTYTLSRNVNPEGAGHVSLTPENETYESGAEVNLTATPAGGYIFDRWGGDAAGSSAILPIAMDSDKSVIAYFKPKDPTPPDILAVTVCRRTDLAVTVMWTTDDPAASQVEYGTTRDYGHTTASDEGLKQEHEVRIPGLEANTKYYFRVKSVNESGIEAESHTNTFTTLYAIPVGHEVGNRAPLFGPLREYTDVGNTQSPNNGEMVDLKSFLGKKKVLLDFWSTSCSACIAQFPLIRELYLDENWADSNSEYSDFAVITVCIDGHRTDRIDILRDKYSNPEKFGPFTFPILLDEEGTVKDPYHIWRIPCTVFIDSEGIIRETQIGRFHEREEIESILNRLE